MRFPRSATTSRLILPLAALACACGMAAAQSGASPAPRPFGQVGTQRPMGRVGSGRPFGAAATGRDLNVGSTGARRPFGRIATDRSFGSVGTDRPFGGSDSLESMATSSNTSPPFQPPLFVHPGGGTLRSGGSGFWYDGDLIPRGELEDWRDALRAPVPLPVTHWRDAGETRRLGPVLDRGLAAPVADPAAYSRAILREAHESLRRGHAGLARELIQRLHEQGEVTADSLRLQAVAAFALGHVEPAAQSLRSLLALGTPVLSRVLEPDELDRLLEHLARVRESEPDTEAGGRTPRPGPDATWLVSAWFEWEAGRPDAARDALERLRRGGRDAVAIGAIERLLERAPGGPRERRP